MKLLKIQKSQRLKVEKLCYCPGAQSVALKISN